MNGANKLTELLRPHVQELQADAAAGDQKARQVIDLYQLHVSCPSAPGAPALCEATFREWCTVREALGSKVDRS